MGFKQSTSDPFIYTSTTESDGLFILALYVDDILLAGKSQHIIAQVKADLGKRFQLKDMGELLGVSIQQRAEEIWIGQPAYTQAVVKKFGMEHCKPANTPVTSGTKLLKATEQSEVVDASPQLVVCCTCLDGLDQILHLQLAMLPDFVPVLLRNTGP